MSKNKTTVRQIINTHNNKMLAIVKDYIEINGGMGLQNRECECSCSVERLQPCDGLCLDCEVFYELSDLSETQRKEW